MKAENAITILSLLHTVRGVLAEPHSREEEDIHHLINALEWRVKKILSDNEPSSPL